MSSAIEKPTRDANGRWLPGTPSPNAMGRKPLEYENALVDLRRVCAEVIANKLTVGEWGLIVDKQIERAKQGNDKALEWLSKWAAPPQNQTSLPSFGVGVGVAIEPRDYRDSMQSLLSDDEEPDEATSADT